MEWTHQDGVLTLSFHHILILFVGVFYNVHRMLYNHADGVATQSKPFGDGSQIAHHGDCDVHGLCSAATSWPAHWQRACGGSTGLDQ